jgi:hypothetical protein
MRYYRLTDETGAVFAVCVCDSINVLLVPHIRSAEQITKEEYERGLKREAEGLSDAVP